MEDRTAIAVSLIIGGAIVAASLQLRPRYALLVADRTSAWRLDTGSGQVDVCTAVLTPQGPFVQCGTRGEASAGAPNLRPDTLIGPDGATLLPIELPVR